MMHRYATFCEFLVRQFGCRKIADNIIMSSRKCSFHEKSSSSRKSRKSSRTEDSSIAPNTKEEEEEEAGASMEDCPICLSPLHDMNICRTACNHVYHLSCIIQSVKAGTDVPCPLCRSLLHQYDRKYTPQEKKLLCAVTNKNWVRMHELLHTDDPPTFRATIEIDDYPHDSTLNLGMTALHFCARDSAPLEIIKEIYENFPAALFMTEEALNYTPYELLMSLDPEEIISRHGVLEFDAIKTYFETLLGRNNNNDNNNDENHDK